VFPSSRLDAALDWNARLDELMIGLDIDCDFIHFQASVKASLTTAVLIWLARFIPILGPSRSYCSILHCAEL